MGILSIVARVLWTKIHVRPIIILYYIGIPAIRVKRLRVNPPAEDGGGFNPSTTTTTTLAFNTFRTSHGNMTYGVRRYTVLQNHVYTIACNNNIRKNTHTGRRASSHIVCSAWPFMPRTFTHYYSTYDSNNMTYSSYTSVNFYIVPSRVTYTFRRRIFPARVERKNSQVVCHHLRPSPTPDCDGSKSLLNVVNKMTWNIASGSRIIDRGSAWPIRRVCLRTNRNGVRVSYVRRSGKRRVGPDAVKYENRETF